MSEDNLEENIDEVPPVPEASVQHEEQVDLPSRNYKRRNYLINKEFQFRFILFTFIPTAFCLILFYSAIQFYYTRLIQEGLASGLNAGHPYFNLINEQIRFMNVLFLTCSISSFIFFVVWGIFISHKIAGPLYRLTKFFKEAQPGMITQKLNFRPGDFFLEIPEAINEWVDRSK